VGSAVDVSDRFDTRNRFYGGHVGWRGQWQEGRLAIETEARVALGVSDEAVDVADSHTFTTAGGDQTRQAGGLLALPSGSGSFSRERFAVVPEVGLRVSYRLTECLHAFVGYDFLYWSSVVRPADQVDRAVDSRQLAGLLGAAAPAAAGVARPAVPPQGAGLWVQGIGLGLELRY
jgi:hypothetical protein